MSIINEALKKAWKEKENIPSSSYQDSVKKKLDLEFHKKKSRLNWAPIFVVLVLLLITGPIVAPFFSTPFKPSTPSATRAVITPLAESTSNKKAQFGVEEAGLFRGLAPQAMHAPNFNLTGIVYSPKDSFCIINDQVIKVGEDIQGAKLVNVGPNEVILDYKGNKVQLSMA